MRNEMIYPSEWDLTRPIYIENSPFLFHYTTYSSALGILISQQMRMGSLANMNDPLEFENHRGDGLIFSGNPSNRYLAKKVFEFANAVAEKDRAVRLASFAVDGGNQKDYYNNLCKGWARSRMWAQYADNHKGVCLIFDKDKIIKTFKKEFKKPCKTYCNAVNYTNNLESLKEVLSSSCKSLLVSDKIDYLFQKCEDFEDEQEFRLLLINKKLKDSKEIVSFSIANSICGVITGAKFPKENELTLQKAIKCCNTEIRRFYISWHYGMPNVTDPEYHKLRVKEILGE